MKEKMKKKHGEMIFMNGYDTFRHYLEFIKNSEEFNSFVCIGRAGTGKTTLTEKVYPNAVKVSGHIAPLTLFEMLKQNANDIILIDDANGVLQNKTSLELLKSCINPMKDNKRIVMWDSKKAGDSIKDRAFIFYGKLIILANHISDNSDCEAIISKSLTYYHEPTNSEVVEEIIKYGQGIDAEVLDFLDKNAGSNYSLDMRKYHKTTALKKQFPESWKDLTFPLVNSNDKDKLMYSLLNSGKSVAQQIEEFKNKTGKSRATYFNQKKSRKY